MTSPEKRILAAYDNDGVVVYQAFRAAVVTNAVRLGTFGAGFSLDRMTWIKPSFGWMLHRSEYATKHRMEAIARITITHEGFLAILEQGISTMYQPGLHATEDEWASALGASDVRYQWDPDRDTTGRKLARRAIQLGIRGETVRRYVRDWIVRVEDVTSLAHCIREALMRGGSQLPELPAEREYPVSPGLTLRLGYDAGPGPGTIANVSPATPDN